MKESVGPVDTGDSGVLPDFSRAGQIFGCVESPECRVKASLSPLSPACRQASEPVHKVAVRMKVVGTEPAGPLVPGSLPWFMPHILHRPIGTSAFNPCPAFTYICCRTPPARRWR